MATLDFTDYVNVELNGVDLKSIELGGVPVWVRVDLPVITTQPKGATVSSDDTFEVTIVAETGDGTLTYKWFLNGTAQPNSNKAKFTFPKQAAGSYNVYCNVTNERGTVKSAVATITVKASGLALTIAKANDFFQTVGYTRGYAGSLVPDTLEGQVIYSIGTAASYQQLTQVYFGVNGNEKFQGATRIRVIINNTTTILTWGNNSYGLNSASGLRTTLLNNIGKTLPVQIEKA